MLGAGSKTQYTGAWGIDDRASVQEKSVIGVAKKSICSGPHLFGRAPGTYYPAIGALSVLLVDLAFKQKPDDPDNGKAGKPISGRLIRVGQKRD
jgi:hypothetical protein